MKTRVPSVDELKERAQVEARGEEWPPIDKHIEQREKLESLEEEVQRLRIANQRKPSRAQMMDDLIGIFKRYGVEPIEELIKLAQGSNLTPDQRIRIWSELAGYRHPKLKSVEVQAQVDMNFTIVVRKFGESLDSCLTSNKESPLLLNAKGEVIR